MSRYIDANALEEEFKKELDQVRTMDIPKGEEQYWDGYDDGICNGWVMVSEDGHFAPTIDAVSVVRCKECKHWERLNYEAPKEGWCDDQMPYSDGRWVDANDFCSYGERKDDE